jgi:hypothetical protein
MPNHRNGPRNSTAIVPYRNHRDVVRPNQLARRNPNVPAVRSSDNFLESLSRDITRLLNPKNLIDIQRRAGDAQAAINRGPQLKFARPQLDLPVRKALPSAAPRAQAMLEQVQKSKALAPIQSLPPTMSGSAHANLNAPVSSAVVASQYQTTATIVPYYKPGKRTGTGFEASGMTSLGILNLGALNNSGGLYVANQVVLSLLLDKTLWTGHQIGDNMESFERVTWKWLKFYFLPNVGSTTPGTLWFFSDNDSADPLSPLETLTSAFICSHRLPIKHKLWDGVATGPINVNRTRLYTDYALTTMSSTTGETTGDPRLFTSGVFNVATGDGLASTLSQVGELFVEGGFAFDSPQRSDMSSLVFSAKAWAKAPSANLYTLGSGATAGAIEPFSVLVANIPLQTQNYEIVYNPRFVSAVTGSLTLPPGQYKIEHRLILASGGSFSGAPTVATTAANTIYSLESVAQTQTAVAGPPEFTVPTTGVTITGPLVFSSTTLRITQTSIQNANTITKLTSNLSGGVFVLAQHSWCYRCPDFQSVPLAACFPQGASTNTVTLPHRSSTVQLKVDDEVRFQISVPNDYIDQAKEVLFKRFLESDEKATSVDYCIVSGSLTPSCQSAEYVQVQEPPPPPATPSEVKQVALPLSWFPRK